MLPLEVRHKEVESQLRFASLVSVRHGGTRSSWEAELKDSGLCPWEVQVPFFRELQEEAAHPVQFPLTEEQAVGNEMRE